jgi:hypothetical protein
VIDERTERATSPTRRRTFWRELPILLVVAIVVAIAVRAFVLQTEWRDIPATRDGVESTAPARWIFRGTVSGDTATGTMTLELQNAGGDRSQPFKAKRAD